MRTISRWRALAGVIVVVIFAGTHPLAEARGGGGHGGGPRSGGSHSSGSHAGGSHSGGAHAGASRSGGKSYSSRASPGAHSVRGYTRKNGTYVAPHRATNPDKSKANNWSAKGNVNPDTGKAGTKDPGKR